MRALSIMVKPVSGSCNMRCGYCFYADVSHSREVENRGLMSRDTLEALVKNALSEAEEQCVFAFQGGEPTLAGLDFFQDLIKLEKKYNVNSVRTHHALQTNGLLLDEAWAEFLAGNHFLTGLSIDGEKAVHDHFRLDAAGKGTHSRCLKAARLLETAGAEYNILTVVTKQLAAHPDRSYRFYKRENLRYLQFIPCLDELEGERSHTHSLNAADYGAFLCRIFDLWYDDFCNGDVVSIRTFDNYLQMLAGYPPENCAMSGICSVNALVEADGSVYPCDFYAVDDYYLGNLREHSFGEIYESAAARRFVEESRQLPERCVRCEYFALCRGGCRRDCIPFLEGRRQQNRYCGAYKQFFTHALPRMEQLVSHLRRCGVF